MDRGQPGTRDRDRGGEPDKAAADNDRIGGLNFYRATASRLSRPLGMMTEPPYDPTNSASK
jgi:hypothetical protein